jgi:hypothetical protein
MSTTSEVPVTPEQSHADSAQARIQEIRALRQKIPNLVIPVTRMPDSGFPLPPRFRSSSWS